MTQLTCSRLSSYRMATTSCPWGKMLVFVLLSGELTAQAQIIDPSLKSIEPSQRAVVLLPAGELPAQALESNAATATQKPNLFNRTTNWLRSRNLPGDLQIHGFASQGYITTSDNDVFGNSNNGGSFGLTEAGLNVSVRPLPKLQLSAQVLSRRAGKGNDGMPRLDYAILDYQLYSHEANQYGIRIGRLKNPFGFYNETRDVAHTRPSILLPQSIYFDRTRNLGLSGDSIQLYGETAIGSIGTFSTQLGVFWPIVNDKDTEVSLIASRFSPQPLGGLNRDASFIGRGIFETNDKRLRLGISGIWLNTSYDPHGITDPVRSGSLQFTPIYFSAQYNAEKWSITSEYAIRHFKYDSTFSSNMLINGKDFFGESYYVQGEYRFTPKWEGFIRYDALYTDRSDRNGKEFQEELLTKYNLPIAAHSRFAKDITVGLRWNVTPEFMLRAEYHRVNGTGWLSRLDNPSTEGPMSQHWDLYAIQASYRF